MTTRNRAAAATPRRDEATGTWWFIVDTGAGADGKRRQARRRGFVTKKAAQEALDAIRVGVTQQTFVAPAKQTVADYLRAWLDAQTIRLRASTVNGYTRNLENYVIPVIGRVRLDVLTTQHLDKLYADLLRTGKRLSVGGLSPRSVRYVHVTLSKALSDAVRKGVLARNVAEAADVPSNKSTKPKEMAWWKPAELRQFLAMTADEDLGPLFRVAAMTGMRRGEVCGLRWVDVDLERATIKVRRQLLSAGKDHGTDEGLYFEEVPKTDSGRRTVDLDPGTVAALKVQRARQAAHKLAVGPGYRDDDLVFAKPDGAPLHPEHVAKVFGRRVARSGLPRVRFHDLRHTHATHLIAAGEGLLLITKRLGHSSVSFTQDRYGHLFEEAGSQAASAVAAMVDGAVVTNL